MSDADGNLAAWNAAASTEAPAFGDEGDDARRLLLTPTLISLLGDVRGRRVLDAGCGQGYLSRLLARRGAQVCGVEAAANWLRYAVEREQAEPLGIAYVESDLCGFVADAPFAAVVANMVLMDIADLEGALRACVAALAPSGSLVFSISHPCFEDHGDAWAERCCIEVRDYLRPREVQQRIGVRYHRPLSAYLNASARLGLRLRQLIEPGLPADSAAHGPWYARNVHVPSFLVVHATKD